MAEKDRIEKTLEAYNDVFADIMNGLLFQGQPVVSADALTDAFPFSVYKADGDIHEQERDVSKYLNTAEKRQESVWHFSGWRIRLPMIGTCRCVLSDMTARRIGLRWLEKTGILY